MAKRAWAWLLAGLYFTIAGLGGANWAAAWALFCGTQCGVAFCSALEAAHRRQERRRG